MQIKHKLLTLILFLLVSCASPKTEIIVENPTETAVPTASVTPRPSVTPSPTPMPIEVIFNYFQADGLRSSPRIDSGFFRTVEPGEVLLILAFQPEPYKAYRVRTEDGSEGWLLWKLGMFDPLEEGQVQIIKATSTPKPVAPSGEPNSSSCVCTIDTYNCSDFNSQSAAQSCFNKCGPADIHDLDSDGDGRVCESLP